MHSIHKGEVLYFLVCKFGKAIKNFEVDVNVKRGP